MWEKEKQKLKGEGVGNSNAEAAIRVPVSKSAGRDTMILGVVNYIRQIRSAWKNVLQS